MHIFNYCVV